MNTGKKFVAILGCALLPALLLPLTASAADTPARRGARSGRMAEA